MTIDEAREQIEQRIRGLGFTIKYRPTNTGRVWYGAKVCSIPNAKTRTTLYTVCHELFHCLEKRRVRVYINEMKAEKFAHDEMRRLGFTVPRKQTQRAKRYVAYKIRKARSRGLKEIDPEVKQFLL